MEIIICTAMQDATLLLNNASPERTSLIVHEKMLLKTGPVQA